LTEKVLKDLKRDVEHLKLIPSTGGCFEVWVGDEQIYSKLETGEFPDEEAILEQIRGRVESGS
jgi:selenoprotein W-related protein